MKALLVLTTSMILVFIVIILKLLLKIRMINRKMKYVDEANMWHKLAVTDNLTGTYNRNAYNLYINEVDVKKKLCGIILFDIDDFKTINDTKGHQEGDIVLKNVAKIIKENFPGPKYNVFRMGGDEFSVLSEDVPEDEIIGRLIELKNYLIQDGNISLSKGYSIIKDDSEKAYKNADDMLYADKLTKKSRKS